MFSEKRENWVLRDNLQPVCFCFWISITGRVLYPLRIVEMERGTSSKGGCCELLLADAARPCSSRLEFEILCKFFNCKGMWPSREPCWLSSRFILTWKVRTICIILKLKHIFPAPYAPNNLYLHLLWKQRPKSNQNIPNHCISMDIRQSFTCLNCIPPIKFHFAKLHFAPSRVNSMQKDWI